MCKWIMSTALETNISTFISNSHLNGKKDEEKSDTLQAEVLTEDTGGMNIILTLRPRGEKKRKKKGKEKAFLVMPTGCCSRLFSIFLF